MATQSNGLNALCAQLLSREDIDISRELIEQVKKEKVFVKIESLKEKVSIRIFAMQKFKLSEITPILHNFGFVIVDEVSYHFEEEDGAVYVNRFNLDMENLSQIAVSKENIETILAQALRGETFSGCKLFSLVLGQNIALKEVMLLRAIIEYVNQAVIELNFELILHTLAKYDHIAKLFVDYFKARFSPKMAKRENEIKKLEALVEESIKEVPTIIDDKILKLVYVILRSTVRTNYFMHKESITLKIMTSRFATHLKGTQPYVETFVYHPEFSGVHLRMSLISRGGLRWSERHEDFRMEIKSLMATQEGKNSIIIPSGAKGGFIIKKPQQEITKEYFTRIYSMFIDNLLDMVDNRVEGKSVCMNNTVTYDGEDSYFVVAADKGTAAMSDVANAIAVKRGFWLGDAFASGGSNGYNHKELGITAKGSLVATKRFFIEKGIDFHKESITVVGIGSMNGDVFGNGMIESDKFRLLAAISHKEIFVDPNPDPQTSYEERKRLFHSSNGGWESYNRELISKGGGVYLRSQKSIELSDEIKKMIGTTRKSLSGEELAKKLLSMKVDLLFNGGVGTYVKSSDESNLDLGDKQNEAVRLDGSELKAAIVCEGGNLGFTQKARIEYALAGGKINLDAIDNAAGVNTSDHEVNLKILLQYIYDKGLIDEGEKGEILKSLTDQVVNMILWDNYFQALRISQDEILSRIYPGDFIDTIGVLEREVASFKRRDFFIPKNENIEEIISNEGTMVRPVLAVLLSYAKIFVKQILLESKLIDEPFARDYLFKYFPKTFVVAYRHEISDHPLAREIIATKLANMLINDQGVIFVCNYDKLGKEEFVNKIKSFLLINKLFHANDIRFETYRHDFVLNVDTQYKLLRELEHTMYIANHTMTNYLKNQLINAEHILDYQEKLFELLEKINKNEVKEILPENHFYNLFFSVIDYLRFASMVIMIKENTHKSFEDVSTIFYRAVNEFQILTIIEALDEIALVGPSEVKLREQALDFIEFTLVQYTKNVLSFQRTGEAPGDAFDSYLINHKEKTDAIFVQIDHFLSQETKDIKEIMVLVNQFMRTVV